MVTTAVVSDGGAGSIHGTPRRQCCLRRREACDWHAEGIAGDVVHSQAIAEDDRGGVPAVLAANAELEIGPRLAAEIAGHRDELPDTRLIQYLERIVLDDPVLQVVRQELPRVIPGEAPGCL